MCNLKTTIWKQEHIHKTTMIPADGHRGVTVHALVRVPQYRTSKNCSKNIELKYKLKKACWQISHQTHDGFHMTKQIPTQKYPIFINSWNFEMQM